MSYDDNIFLSTPEEIDPEEYVIAKYQVNSDFTTRKAGQIIAAEESIGTWTKLKHDLDFLKANLVAKVFEFSDKNQGIISIAFPVDLFDIEIGSIPNLLSIIAGNLFGLTEMRTIRLLDVNFPEAYIKYFPGPKFGIEGIRKLCGTTKSRRPHVGTIIKPKVGLDPDQTAEVAYRAAQGGLDLIKDDETLTSQKFCPFEERLVKVMENLDEYREDTGKNVLYAINISSDYDKMLELADFAVENGANCLMIDVLTSGYSSVKIIAEDKSIKLPIHIHRTMHGAITRSSRYGISMLTIAKIVRLVGGDQLHTGTAAGKMGESEDLPEIKQINKFLRSKWFNIKSTFPVASGGIHPGIVPRNIELLGKDIVIQAGGGVHGHPDGTTAGAKAMVQAVEAVMKNKSLRDYSRNHDELGVAIKKWEELYKNK
ncbi:MAG: ribulose 1,5-bisphosphate carboxylase [Candidatus Lokiarchaeota archaeon]|nr:ribulose 1,5-bisphosphate carboxylase [Candidatus Lokiarchaeota archaeon]